MPISKSTIKKVINFLRVQIIPHKSDEIKFLQNTDTKLML